MTPMMVDALGEVLRRAFGRADPGAVRQWADVLVAIDDRVEEADRRFAEDLVVITPKLKGYARSLTREDSSADDLVQDTLLRAWKARAHFIPGSSLRAWTFTILKRIHLSNGRRKRFVGDYDEALERSLSSEETQSVTIHLGDVERAFAELSDDQRTALQLVAVEQLSYEHVARFTGVPIGTVKSRVARGRQALVALLSAEVTIPPANDPTALRLAAVERWRSAKASGEAFPIG